jgi:hypothetical protein
MSTLRFAMLGRQIDHWHETLTQSRLSVKGMGNWEGRIPFRVFGVRVFPLSRRAQRFSTAGATLVMLIKLTILKNSPP